MKKYKLLFIMIFVALSVVTCNSYDFFYYPNIGSIPSSVEFKSVKMSGDLEKKRSVLTVYNSASVGALKISSIYIAKHKCEYGEYEQTEMEFKIFKDKKLENEIKEWSEENTILLLPFTAEENLSVTETGEHNIYAEIAYTPSDLKDDFLYICFKNDSRKNPLHSVHIQATVGVPSLGVSLVEDSETEGVKYLNSTLDMGIRKIANEDGRGENTSSKASLEIKNKGDDDLVINDVNCDVGDSFTVSRTSGKFCDADTILLKPQDKINIEVSFKPKEKKIYSRVITFETNDPENQTGAIDLTGVGEYPKTAPVAVLNLIKSESLERFKKLTFDASGSYDDDNRNEGVSIHDNIRYKWSLVPLDGQPLQDDEKSVKNEQNDPVESDFTADKRVVFTAVMAGNYELNLVVKDDEGEIATVKEDIYIEYDYEIYVTLQWNSPGTGKEPDFDLHFVKEGGRLGGIGNDFGVDDCYFRVTTLDWGVVGDSSDDVFLTRDDTDAGIEIITYNNPEKNREYVPIVHYYKSEGEVEAVLKVYINGILVANEKSGDYSNPAAENGASDDSDNETDDSDAATGKSGDGFRSQDEYWMPVKIKWNDTNATIETKFKEEINKDSTLTW